MKSWASRELRWIKMLSEKEVKAPMSEEQPVIGMINFTGWFSLLKFNTDWCTWIYKRLDCAFGRRKVDEKRTFWGGSSKEAQSLKQEKFISCLMLNQDQFGGHQANMNNLMEWKRKFSWSSFGYWFKGRVIDGKISRRQNSKKASIWSWLETWKQKMDEWWTNVLMKSFLGGKGKILVKLLRNFVLNTTELMFMKKYAKDL